MKALRFYQILCLVLIAAVGFLTAHIVRSKVTDWSPPSSQPFIQAGAPYSEMVERIVEPLRYSGVPDFLREDIALTLDFENRTWTLRNIHSFDAEGNVLLNEGKYGVCGDLSAYTYQKIRPIFDPKYKIEFIEAAEASFFKPGSGSHIILRIVDTSEGQEGNEYASVYILDPSLRRYGSPDLFGQYLPIKNMPQLPFVEEKSGDETFKINDGPPIVITRRGVLFLFVKDQQGRFDPDNFRIELAAMKRYQYLSEPLFVIKKVGGQVQITESAGKISWLLAPGVYDQLKKRLFDLFGRLEEEIQKAPS